MPGLGPASSGIFVSFPAGSYPNPPPQAPRGSPFLEDATPPSRPFHHCWVLARPLLRLEGRALPQGSAWTGPPGCAPSSNRETLTLARGLLFSNVWEFLSWMLFIFLTYLLQFCCAGCWIEYMCFPSYSSLILHTAPSSERDLRPRCVCKTRGRGMVVWGRALFSPVCAQIP